jgi:hypothetical protein
MRQTFTLIFLSGFMFTITGCGSVGTAPFSTSATPLISSTAEVFNTSTITTVSNHLLKRVENISKTLKEKGIPNKYKNISEPMDVGSRYVFTFETSLSDYKLFVMTPDFASGVGEGGPTSFTPKNIDFSASQNEIVAQLQKPGGYKENNIQYSKKAATNLWIFGDFGYAEPNYFVQALSKDSAGFGYLLSVDVPDSKYPSHMDEAFMEVNGNAITQNIFSTVIR